jgi:phosphatidylserine/phosphatidylglycerophosphate/cardiolipin synthase-like enzyme
LTASASGIPSRGQPGAQACRRPHRPFPAATPAAPVDLGQHAQPPQDPGVDDEVGFTGGMNISDRHLVDDPTTATATADIHFRLNGPVVLQLRREFFSIWEFSTGDTDEPRSALQPRPGRTGLPHHHRRSRRGSRPPDHAADRRDQPKPSESVRIMTPYFPALARTDRRHPGGRRARGQGADRAAGEEQPALYPLGHSQHAVGDPDARGESALPATTVQSQPSCSWSTVITV